MTRSNNPLVAAIKGSIRHCNPSRHGSLYYIDPRELMKALERADELSRAATVEGYRVSYERKDGAFLIGEMWPVREQPPLYCSEAEAWDYAQRLAAPNVGHYVNLYVIHAKDFTPVEGYQDKFIRNRPRGGGEGGEEAGRVLGDAQPEAAQPHRIRTPQDGASPPNPTAPANGLSARLREHSSIKNVAGFAQLAADLIEAADALDAIAEIAGQNIAHADTVEAVRDLKADCLRLHREKMDALSRPPEREIGKLLQELADAKDEAAHAFRYAGIERAADKLAAALGESERRVSELDKLVEWERERKLEERGLRLAAEARLAEYDTMKAAKTP